LWMVQTKSLLEDLGVEYNFVFVDKWKW